MRRRPAVRVVITALVTLLAAAGLVSCRTPASSRDPNTLTIGYIPAITAGGVPAIATALGLFEKANLKVKLVPFTSGPAQAAAMAGGSLDIEYLGGPAIWAPARGQGTIIALSDISFDAAILARAGSGIRTPTDLRGRTVGVSRGNSSEFILQAALDAAGIGRDEIKMVNVDPPTAVAAFAGGRGLTAVATFLPFSGAITKQVPDAVTVARSRDFPQYALPGVYVASKSVLAHNRDAVRRFLEVATQAIDLRARDRNRTIAYTARLTRTPLAALTAQYDAEQWPNPAEILSMYTDGRLTTLLSKIQKIMVEMGALTQPVPPARFTDLSIHSEVLTKYIARTGADR